MQPLYPISNLPTHEVLNMPPHLGDQDLWSDDIALREGVVREGASWAVTHMARFGALAGREDIFEKADRANRNPPELRAFDRYGMRINQVEFHPAYHELLELAVGNEVPSFAWKQARPGAHVGHAALTYMMSQAEGGVMCPMAMTYSAIPSLRHTPALADEWIPRLLSTSYDARDIPVERKTGATIGMFMTEKQGGSDVRSNSTRARPAGPRLGAGAEYLLTGHKFFCSAPMSDAFLTLAHTDAGLSCFLIPRWTPDGQRNALFIQRVKDKLGNRSNASSEIELHDAWGVMLGDEGRGIRTIIDMVVHNRFYCCASSAGLMRQSIVQALHYACHRSVFQRKLIDQPVMSNVLADLVVEAEAALALTLRLARAIDESDSDPVAASLARIGTAIGKYWICKRAPGVVGEALECHGGSGYIEESILPRLYREAPLNSIWEGSGNVMCLDVLRALSREPETLPALFAEFESVRGANANLDATSDWLQAELANQQHLEVRARALTESMALAWQGALLLRSGSDDVATAFCNSRLSMTGPGWRGAYGVLPADTPFADILTRAASRQ